MNKLTDEEQIELNTKLFYLCGSSGKSINIEDIQLLLDQGADVNGIDQNRDTPLHFALVNPKINLAIVKCLVKNGADINSTSNMGNTPFFVSLENPNMTLDIVKYLLYSGAMVNCRNACSDLDTALRNFTAPFSLLDLSPFS